MFVYKYKKIVLFTKLIEFQLKGYLDKMSGVRNGVKLARKFVIGNKFQGLPKLGDLKIVEESLPALGKGGQLI